MALNLGPIIHAIANTNGRAAPSPDLGVHSLPNLPGWLSPNIFNGPHTSKCAICLEKISRTEDLLWMATNCSNPTDLGKVEPARHTHLYHAECLNVWWSASPENTANRKCELCRRPVTRFLIHARLTPRLWVWYDWTVTPSTTRVISTITRNRDEEVSTVDPITGLETTHYAAVSLTTRRRKTIPTIYNLHATSSPGLEALLASHEDTSYDLTAKYLSVPITTTLPTPHHFLAMTKGVATLWPLAVRRAMFLTDGPAFYISLRGTTLVQDMQEAVDKKALMGAVWEDLCLGLDEGVDEEGEADNRDDWDRWYEGEERPRTLLEQERELLEEEAAAEHSQDVGGEEEEEETLESGCEA